MNTKSPAALLIPIVITVAAASLAIRIVWPAVGVDTSNIETTAPGIPLEIFALVAVIALFAVIVVTVPYSPRGGRN